MMKTINRIPQKAFPLSSCKILIAFVFLLTNLSIFGQGNSDRLAYIDKFKDIAIKEMERAGIPASIKLAQGILESNAGKSVLARKANNHFGIKCGSSWDGKTYYREDDDYDAQGNLLKSCFRGYKNAESSYIAHSEFLRDPKKDYRYGFLFRLDGKDYRRWALGLKKAGYATNPHYPDLLVKIIEDYELYTYDNMSSNDILPVPPDMLASEDQSVIVINDVRIALAKENETPQEIAERTSTSLSCLMRYNAELKKHGQQLEKDYRVFLQKKRRAYRGTRKYHYVQKDERLFDISQLYGVRLDRLYSRNRIPEGKEPAVGQRIKLRGWFKVNKNKAPKLRKIKSKQEEEDTLPATIPVRDMDQDPEIDFDDTLPSTSVDDFELPDTEGSDNDRKPTRPSNSNNNTSGSTPSFPQTPTPTRKPPVVVQVPTQSPPKTPPSVDNTTKVSVYTVKDGDTLYRISRRFEMTVPRLKQLNGLTSNTINAGQQLKLY